MTVLEAERRSRGWSQTTLAYHAQTTQGEISKFERRLLVPRPSQAARLSYWLGVPPDALLREVREPAEPAPSEGEDARG
jgi:transcriptional regulator with XRE-family HTH domain